MRTASCNLGTSQRATLFLLADQNHMSCTATCLEQILSIFRPTTGGPDQIIRPFSKNDTPMLMKPVWPPANSQVDTIGPNFHRKLASFPSCCASFPCNCPYSTMGALVSNASVESRTLLYRSITDAHEMHRSLRDSINNRKRVANIVR